MASCDVVTVRSRSAAEAIDITDRVGKAVSESGVTDGICHVFSAHTTAGVFINENADPDVLDDFLAALERLVPWKDGYRHAEGNAAAHIRSTLMGTTQTVPVRGGRLALGRWQGIFLVEFDGPRDREVRVTVVG